MVSALGRTMSSGLPMLHNLIQTMPPSTPATRRPVRPQGGLSGSHGGDASAMASVRHLDSTIKRSATLLAHGGSCAALGVWP